MTAKRETTAKKVRKDPRAQIIVRCDPKLARRIESLIERREIPTTKNLWMTEAILEKLKREEQGRQRG